MKMTEQLKLMEERRQAELKHLHVTYLRTKRDVRRATSMDRTIRKHMATSLGIALLAGLILASRLGGRRKNKTQTTENNGTIRGQKSLLHQLFTEITTLLLKQLNLPKLVREVFAQKDQKPEEHKNA